MRSLVREGDLGDELIVIVEGSVRVVRAEPDGTERLLRRYEAGDHIGELAVLRERPRAATVDRRGRRRAWPRHRRRGPQVDPARATRGRDGHAGRRSPSASAANDSGTRSRRRALTPAADRDGHVPADRRGGLDGPRAGARARLGRPQPAAPRPDRPCGERHGGVVIRTEGDATFAAFPEAIAAVAAAAEAQKALTGEVWPDGVAIRVRMGLHSGEAHRSGDDYGGFDVNRAARVAAVGHGGQVILSETTTVLVADALPAGTALRDLGRHVLKDVPRPERLSQLDIAGLPNDFPPLRTSMERVGNLPDRVTSFVGRDQDITDLVELASGCAVDDAHRSRRHRQDKPRDRGGPSPRTAIPGRGVVRAALLRWPDPTRSGPRSRMGSGSTTARSGRRHRRCCPSWPTGRWCWSWTTWSTSSTRRTTWRRSFTPRRGAGSSSPVARRSGSQGNMKSPSHRWSTKARALFIDRARAARVGWEPAEDREVIAEICRLLDDLPLGIELAAARVSALSPTVIRDRLAARLPLPGSGFRDAPARQRTLEGAVAWSHDLLSRIGRHCSIGLGYSRADSISNRSNPWSGRRRWEAIDSTTSSNSPTRA